MVKKKKKGPKLIPKPESPSRGRLSSAEDLFDGFTTLSIQSTDNNNITTTDRKNKATNLSIETSINTPIYTTDNNTTTGRIIPLSTPKDSNNDTTTPDIDGYDKFGLILNKKKDSIDDTPEQQGSTTQDNPSITLQQTFPLRRLHSSDSYMSDSSSTTSEEDDLNNIRMLKDEDETEHIFVKHRKGEISDGITESHYAPQRIRPSLETAESSITGNSLTPSAIESQSIGYADTDHSDSNAVHLMTSYQGRIHADASFSSSSDESDIAQQQLPLPLSSQQQLIPPLQMRLRQPISAPAQQSSDDAERSRSNTSFIMSSDDDQNIKNELSVYSLSDKLRRISTGPVDQNTGRHAPVEGHRVDSVETIQSTTPTEVNSFYPNSQSMIESTSAEAAKPRAQHDTSFLKNIRENWALSGSLRSASPDLLSPSGAFVKELNTEDMSSTPQDTTVQSLIYSDEDDNNVRKYPSRPLLSAAVEDEETPLTNTHVQNEQSIQKEVYISRYINLLLISTLNLLNGWTCFSIAPISELAMKALGIEPESVVVLFLTANVCASFLAPPVLGRLGLRRTILLGSLLLMLGNMIKSSTSNTIAAWRIYVGFIISGLSGPFYQHTPFLIYTWFPKHERVMANKIIMHSNQIGIGCSFVLSTQLVIESKDIFSYFHLLSIMSGVIFVGVSLCLSECPRTPPGGQDIVMRGTLERPIIVTTNSANSQQHKNDWRKTRRAMNQNKDRSPEASLPYYYGSTDTSLATPTEHNDNTSIKSSPFPNLKSGNGDTSLRAVTLDYSTYISGQVFRSIKKQLPSTDFNRVEPMLIQTHRFLDIEVCDNQMWQSICTCCTRVGFLHCVMSYASSGMTITTLTTFIGYFITSSNENKATGQVLVGVVGGLFQLLSVISSASASIRRNKSTQKSYMIILALLSVTTLVLILCDLNLDSIERFGCNILMLALVVSPIQPLSSQLGVDVVSPISETTVLIIQQVFSSFLSVCCILACTALRRVSSTSDCLLYLLISIQVLSTIYFSTFHRQYTNYIESKRTRTTGAFQPPSPPRYPKPRTPRDRPVLDDWKDKFPHLWKN